MNTLKQVIAGLYFCVFGWFHADAMPNTDYYNQEVLAVGTSLFSGSGSSEGFSLQQHQIDRDEDLVALLNKEYRQKIRLQRILLVGLLFILVGMIAYLYGRNLWFRKLLFEKNLDMASQNKAPFTPAVKPIPEGADNDSSDNVDHRKMAHLYNRILVSMEENRLYQDPTLTVSALAMALNSNEKYISRAINTHALTTFSAFVNQYRISEARQILLNHPYQFSGKEIASQVGFGTSSTFYRQFKKSTGLSPSQFVEMIHGG